MSSNDYLGRVGEHGLRDLCTDRVGISNVLHGRWIVVNLEASLRLHNCPICDFKADKIRRSDRPTAAHGRTNFNLPNPTTAGTNVEQVTQTSGHGVEHDAIHKRCFAFCILAPLFNESGVQITESSWRLGKYV